jgi:hypothetical protein
MDERVVLHSAFRNFFGIGLGDFSLEFKFVNPSLSPASTKVNQPSVVIDINQRRKFSATLRSSKR